MLTEKRKYPRYEPNDLAANITIASSPPGNEIMLEGTVVNMSYTGIKIKLNTAVKFDSPESDITINLTLPESGIPISIRGKIKHLQSESEYGLEFSENYSADEVDDLIFECIKIVDKQL